MTFGLAIAYVRRSRDVFDPLRVRALERAAEIANEPIAHPPTGTTDRAPTDPHPTDATEPREGETR
jgi:hypothetical protein